VKRIITTHVAVTVGVVIIALLMLLYALLGQEVPKQIANIVLLGTAVTICVGWFPAFRRVLVLGIRNGPDRLIATVWLSWTALLIHRIYIILNDSLGYPDWLVDGPGSIIVVALIIVSGWYAVIAPITDPEIPTRFKVWDRIAIVLGSIVMSMAAIVYYTSWF
jgi:hypothetical protein